MTKFNCDMTHQLAVFPLNQQCHLTVLPNPMTAPFGMLQTWQ